MGDWRLSGKAARAAGDNRHGWKGACRFNAGEAKRMIGDLIKVMEMLLET
jgi:hypothetical protein